MTESIYQIILAIFVGYFVASIYLFVRIYKRMAKLRKVADDADTRYKNIVEEIRRCS
jgi:ABC-type siderophore export system fused ATPase/permease subunit